MRPTPKNSTSGADPDAVEAGALADDLATALEAITSYQGRYMTGT